MGVANGYARSSSYPYIFSKHQRPSILFPGQQMASTSRSDEGEGHFYLQIRRNKYELGLSQYLISNNPTGSGSVPKFGDIAIDQQFQTKSRLCISIRRMFTDMYISLDRTHREDHHRSKIDGKMGWSHIPTQRIKDIVSDLHILSMQIDYHRNSSISTHD
jgi:hypothetical protein